MKVGSPSPLDRTQFRITIMESIKKKGTSISTLIECFVFHRKPTKT